MGNSSSTDSKSNLSYRNSTLLYSYPLSPNDPSKNETPVYRNHYTKDRGLTSGFRDQPEIRTVQHIYLYSMKKYADQPYLGRINSEGVFTFKTYEQVKKTSTELGSAILNKDLAPWVEDHKGNKFRFLCVYAKNRREWMELDIACAFYGITVVPIYDTLGPDTVKFVFDQTGAKTIFCAGNYVDKIINSKDKMGNLEYIISFDPVTLAQKEEAAKKNFFLMYIEELLAFGLQTLPYHEARSDDVHVLCYTSGTTGTPKAAMLTHGNLVSVVASVEEREDLQIFPEDSYLSYLPLAHSMERVIVTLLTWKGCRIGFFRGDTHKIMDDLQALKPSLFVSVPRIFNRVYDKMWGELNNLKGLKRTFVFNAIEKKKKNLHERAQYTHAIYDPLIFQKMKNALGGNVRYALTGAAPIDKEVIDFLRIAFCCPVFEGYGQTESCAFSFLTVAEDPANGHVGSPANSIEFKLVDVPEMNYSSQDKDENGNLRPRGEICFRGSTVFKGYFKDDEKTAEAIDADGWLHTGDVAQINPNGSVTIIDRKKNIFKLSQGEYIAPEKIENIYSKCKYVAEAFVYGDSLRHYLVGIIVPPKEKIIDLGNELGLAGKSYEELCENEQVVEAVLKELKEVGKKNGLYSFEQVQKIYLEPQSFGVHGLLTPAMKLKRFQARVFYEQKINELYADN